MVNSTVCFSFVCCSLNYYTSIPFVLHKCWNLFTVAHFGAAIVLFSVRFGAAFCCFSFAFCWSTYVRPLSHLCLLGFVTFVFFTLRCQLFFIIRSHLFFFIKTCASKYNLTFLLPDEACWRNVNSTVCCSSVCCSLNCFTSILFDLHKCRNFFSVAHFDGAIVFFSARFGDTFCCLNFGFCWSSYVRPFSPLSLLAFVTFVIFTIRCQVFFICLCHLFLIINLWAFLCYLWFLLPDETCWRNLVNSTVCCSSVCCSLKYYTSILFVLHKCNNFFSVAHFGSALVFSARFGAAFFCFNFAFCWSSYVCPLSHLSLLAFVTFVFFTLRFQLFFYFSLSPFFLHQSIRLLTLASISPTWWSLWAKSG